MPFKIIVDSCCDLTPAMLQDPCFAKVPLTIQSDGLTFIDDEQFDQASLLWHMKQSEDAPQTACPSLSAYLDAFDCGAEEIYVVTLSALLSGSHNSAAQARLLYLEEHPKTRIHIFNSCSASSGQVLAALKIRELARQGLDFTEVVSGVSQFIQKMETLFVLETLDNLRKNGRLTRLQAIVTGTLKIKLLMGATPEGEICKRGQALSMKQALSKMVEFMANDLAHIGRILCITHCNCLERAFFLKELALKRCNFQDILICETGGISTVYANDGGIVAAY
ncbi:DegV family protein [Pseudoflavonifractor sp. 524-17]|uniref:DegV family protein n=1 Tax=Pseudoflavonifractor sp. 524-17 TaxID=2304577 RepID=UPI00137AA077|nr:DegV family protein [Pseudoflavonifractor sp. 524-17]NCE64314.1 DegV family protein [Pseudoflavonifractor sp. 524-17]